MKIINQLRLHKSTAVNDKIFVQSLFSGNIQVPGLREYTSRLILDDENITARAIMDYIRDKAVALTSNVSHDCMFMNYCQESDG